MMNHGIILGGSLETALGSITGYDSWVSIKRQIGAHRIASHLRDEGWDIEVLDFVFAWTQEELKEFFRSRVTSKTKFLGISQTFEHSEKWTKHLQDIIAWVRKEYPDIYVIGGSKNLYVTFPYDCHYYLTGYGENGIVELLKKLTGQPSNVVIQTVEEHGRMINLVTCDTHHPAYPCKDLTIKYENRDFIQPKEMLGLEFSRGCKFRCKFCSYNVLGVKGDYSRDMTNLTEELKRNYNEWGVTAYSSADETTNDDTDKLRRMADAIDPLEFDPDIVGFIRADLLASRPQDWEYLARIGFWGHYYGIETFNHESGKYIGKGMKPEKLKEGLLGAQKYFKDTIGKYHASFSLICGLPHETRETFDAGVQWLLDNMPGNNITLFPLQIHSRIDDNQKANYSTFDKTWQTEGVFRLMSNFAQMEANEEKLTAWSQKEYQSKHYFKWEHDTFNWYEANKTLDDWATKAEFWQKTGISVWKFHNFTTTGEYTFEDLRGISYYDLGKNIPPGTRSTWPILPEKTLKFFEDYKQRKLSI